MRTVLRTARPLSLTTDHNIVAIDFNILLMLSILNMGL